MPASDPRLVPLYDVDNPSGPDHDYFRTLADEIAAETIVDLGCGTGLLTLTLVGDGRRTVIGVDPDAGMLDYARSRPGAKQVRWVLGDSRALGDANADLAVMSGNVVQHVTGGNWRRTLADLDAALRPGGRLAFEARNPAARAWERWDRDRTHQVRPTAYGPLTQWLEVTEVTDEGLVTFETHSVFEVSGEHLVVPTTLAFRSAEQVVADLEDAGFAIVHLWGGWHREQFSEDSALMVVESAAF